MSKRSIVLGSLVGALAIQGAMIACGSRPMMVTDSGTPPTDGGFVDVIRDVVSDILDANTNDAIAQDSGACQCELPRANITFTATVDRGSGPEAPQADYSTATGSGGARMLPNGQPGFQLNGTANFRLTDGTSVQLACTVFADASRAPVAAESSCRASVAAFGSAASNPVTGVSIAMLEATRFEFRIDSTTIMVSSSNVTFSGIVFRVSLPGEDFLTPPRAYQP